jgi:alkylated DNA repair dioxygenase AlkB
MRDLLDLLDLERYPIHEPDAQPTARLLERCKSELAERGMFNLEGLVRADVIAAAAAEIQTLSDRASYQHARRHNIYFEDRVAGVAADHPALRRFDTVHHTLCGDQLIGTLIHKIYEWPPLAQFLARALDKPRLYLMRDPLARINVLAYRPGETLNWHFDRSRFTTTLLIQAAEHGGEFEYRSDLRSDTDPNYEGVARLLRGEDPKRAVHTLAAGTLNVFAGRNTAHRVTAVGGAKSRLVAVLSYYDQPDVMFSDAERIGFYGRSA